MRPAEPEDFSLLLPDSPNLAEAASRWRSAYVHVPFCVRWCPYCDFTVVEGRLDEADRYVDALVEEVRTAPPWGSLDAVFFGGGTPSLLNGRSIGRVLEALEERFGFSDRLEVSLEANPEDFSEEQAARIVEAGVNRVSFGAQSMDPEVLSRLGRRHTPEDVFGGVENARKAGASSIALDLIFGTPGESLESWGRTISRALDVHPDHISAYALTIEPHTVFGREVRRGGPAPDEDTQATMWETASEALQGAGLIRYEISNFSKIGHVCRYNLSVWGRGEYLGFGLGAHWFRDGTRGVNVRRLDTYIQRVEAGIGAIQHTERVEGWAAEQERLMLGLRRAAGVLPGKGGAVLGYSEEGRRLMGAGVLGWRGDRLVVERPLLTDTATRAVLGLSEPLQ